MFCWKIVHALLARASFALSPYIRVLVTFIRLFVDLVITHLKSKEAPNTDVTFMTAFMVAEAPQTDDLLILVAPPNVQSTCDGGRPVWSCFSGMFKWVIFVQQLQKEGPGRKGGWRTSTHPLKPHWYEKSEHAGRQWAPSETSSQRCRPYHQWSPGIRLYSQWDRQARWTAASRHEADRRQCFLLFPPRAGEDMITANALAHGLGAGVVPRSSIRMWQIAQTVALWGREPPFSTEAPPWSFPSRRQSGGATTP